MRLFFPQAATIGRRLPTFSQDSTRNFTLPSTLAPCRRPRNARPTSRRRTTDSPERGSLRGGGAVFCNPPYSRRTKGNPGQEAWIKKAAEEGQRPGAVVVMLIPARTDTLAFHKYIYHKAEIRFIKGRLRFRVNGQTGDAAPFPSMVVIFRGPEAREEENA